MKLFSLNELVGSCPYVQGIKGLSRVTTEFFEINFAFDFPAYLLVKYEHHLLCLLCRSIKYPNLRHRRDIFIVTSTSPLT